MLTELYRALATPRKYLTDSSSISDRRVKSTALRYLSSLEEDSISELIYGQYTSATNMTDSQSALACLVDLGGEKCDLALSAFHERWCDDPLVLDKWFSVQAMSKRPDALERVVALTKHVDFSLKNPNRMRSLLGVFCAANQVRFHDAGGEGYRLLADVVLELDAMNPQIAARMVSQFNQWRRFEPGRRALMKAELERVGDQPSLSKDVFEIVERSLNE
jgi:aminopeptidase N